MTVLLYTSASSVYTGCVQLHAKVYAGYENTLYSLYIQCIELQRFYCLHDSVLPSGSYNVSH